MIGMLGSYSSQLPPIFETDYNGPVRNWRDERNVFSRPAGSFEPTLGGLGTTMGMGVVVMIVGGLGILWLLSKEPKRRRANPRRRRRRIRRRR